MRKIGFQLHNLAKQGNTKDFLKFVEQNRVFQNLNSLPPMDSSQLISAFAILDISDQRVWNGLENLFIAKQRGMNFQDIVMCASAFSKKSQNSEVWKIIEDTVYLNEENITEMKDIVILFYAFANAKFQSQELWTTLERLVLHLVHRFRPKELSLLAWSFSKMDQGSDLFWTQFEKNLLPHITTLSLQNLSIIAYALAKKGRKDEKVWNFIEKATLNTLKQTDEKNIKPQDIANLVWSFANLGLGDNELWKQFEKSAVKMINKFSSLDITNIAWSFLSTTREYPQFWDQLLDYLKKIKQFNAKEHHDLVILAEVLAKIECKDKQTWTKLADNFEKLFRTGVFHDSMFRARWHKSLFEAKPEIWDEQIEEIYLESLTTQSKERSYQTVQFLYNISLCAFPNFGSDKFWKTLFTHFEKVLEDSELLNRVEAVNMIANLIYIFTAKRHSERESNEYRLENLDTVFDSFYRDDDKFLRMTSEKLNLMVQLKAVVIQRYGVLKRVFWNQLRNNRHLFHFNENDLRPIIFAIVVKLGLYFDPKRSKEFDDTIRNYIHNLGQEKAEELSNHLFDILLQHFSDHEDVLQLFEKDPIVAPLRLHTFFGESSDLGHPNADIQDEYRSIVSRYTSSERVHKI